LVNNSENYTYNRLANKFAGLQPSANAQNQISNNIAKSEDLNSIQAKIQNAQQSIQDQRQPNSNTNDIGEEYLNKLLQITNNNSPQNPNLEMFRNVINDPRFNNINQTPVGMNDSQLLRLFPNIQGTLASDPGKEAMFINNLNKLSSSLDVRETFSQATHNDTTSQLLNKSKPANTDTKRLVVASFLNMIGNNQNLVDTLAQNGPKIFMGDISKSGSGGWYTSDKNMILPMIGTQAGSEQINLASFSKVASHELGHWIDHSDGNIDGFSSMIGTSFQNLRNEVYKGISSGVFDHLNDSYEKYATTNPQEFFAVMGQFFVNNPLAMKDDMPEMYGLFAQAYNMDPTFNGDLAVSSKPMIASSSTPIPSSNPTSTMTQTASRNNARNNINKSSSNSRTNSSTDQAKSGFINPRRSRYS
jgi:Glucose-regulated metallo-peptidase M90